MVDGEERDAGQKPRSLHLLSRRSPPSVTSRVALFPWRPKRHIIGLLSSPETVGEYERCLSGRQQPSATLSIPADNADPIRIQRSATPVRFEPEEVSTFLLLRSAPENFVEGDRIRLEFVIWSERKDEESTTVS